MAFAGANRTGLYYIPEVTWGTTPATPALTPFRYTGESINQNLEYITSDEIRSDRMTADLVQVDASNGGGMDFELSYGAFDPFIEAAMMADFGTAVGITANTDISATVTTNVLSDTAVGSAFANVVVGQWIKVAGFTNSENNGFMRVSAKADDNTITVDKTLVTEAAGNAITITGESLRNGAIRKFFTIQKRFNDATAVLYNNFRGCYVNGMSLNFETGSILTGSFDLLGKNSDMGTTAISGQTDNAAASADVMNAVGNVKNIEFANDPTTARFLSLSMDLANNLREQKAVGTLGAAGIGLGRLEVSGSISIYFEDEVEYNKYVNATSFAVSFRVEDSSGNAYIFTFPNVKYESMSANSGGTDTDVVLDATWRAILDPTTVCMIQIDRFAA